MNFKRMYLIISLLFVISLSWRIYYRIIKNSNELNKIEKFKIYYGSINDFILDDMKNYGMLIVEASHFKREDVEKLRINNKSILIGYLSVLEIGNWDKELLNIMETKDFLIVNGEKVYNEKYKNYLGDISSDHYRKKLINILEERILSKGFQGVFFDTVDWINYFQDNEEVYIKLLEGYKALLMEIRMKFPDIYIIQNRGFGSILDTNNRYINGVLWENFKLENTKDETIKKQLSNIEGKKGISIFTVSFHNQAINQKLSLELGWKHLQINKGSSFNKWE